MRLSLSLLGSLSWCRRCGSWLRRFLGGAEFEGLFPAAQQLQAFKVEGQGGWLVA